MFESYYQNRKQQAFISTQLSFSSLLYGQISFQNVYIFPSFYGVHRLRL